MIRVFPPEKYFNSKQNLIAWTVHIHNSVNRKLNKITYNDISDVKRKLHWDVTEDEGRKIKWFERENKSIERLNQIINNQITGKFGLGGV